MTSASAPRAPGVATMLRALDRELVAAVEHANEFPTKTNRDRVEAIRREIRETAEEGGALR